MEIKLVDDARRNSFNKSNSIEWQTDRQREEAREREEKKIFLVANEIKLRSEIKKKTAKEGTQEHVRLT